MIDFCLTKSLQTDPDTNMTCLRLEWASKANCKQRKGRAGRVSDGQVYRLVSKEFYVNHLNDYAEPEMKRCPLSQLVSLSAPSIFYYICKIRFGVGEIKNAQG